MKPIIIIAGNRAQAAQWALSQQLVKTQWIYVSSREQMLGLHDAVVICVGTWSGVVHGPSLSNDAIRCGHLVLEFR
jgi:hypothetical protein